MRGFVVAGTKSDDGKTTVTLAIMEVLRRRGIEVSAFKAGPDYIDPGHHALLLGRPSYNLDTWMMGVDGVRKTFRAHSSKGGVAVVEGVMGLFDGRDGGSEEGSTAHLAKVLNLPVLLVVNGEKAARSVGALVKGFCDFDVDVNIRWVIFNKVAGEKHFKILKEAVERACRARVLGYIPRDESLMMKSRHLGLITSSDVDRRRWRRGVGKAADYVEAFVDMRPLQGRGKGGVKRTTRERTRKSLRGAVKKPLIAVARDQAFSFYYEENLGILRDLGANICFFSPIKDKTLPEGVNGVYLGGGYPELHAGELAANMTMRESIKSAAQKGVPIFAECGGLMYLGRALKDFSGATHPMAGVFKWMTEIFDKRKALGYREIEVLKGCPFLEEGQRIRGHEFRYSEFTGRRIKAGSVFRAVHPGTGRPAPSGGYVFKNVLATYIHIHFASNPVFAMGFMRLAETINDCQEESK
ncbi:MAG: cobyrinate a,c-diamide synthase [Thermodesulfobacteriota bacterium]